MDKYYVYSFLREDNSPYYIGKGCGRRCYRDGGRKGIHCPTDRNRIKIIKENLSEDDAFALEVLLISQWGRKVNNTGILRNIGSGGVTSNAMRGKKHSEETKRKIREGNKRTKSKGISEETRKRMSEGAKRRAQTPEGLERLRQNGLNNVLERDSGGKFVKK